MCDDETNLEHILRLDVRRRRHVGEPQPREMMLMRKFLRLKLISQDVGCVFPRDEMSNRGP